MATEVKIPALGESITSGILATWHVQDGDIVEAGQTLYDLETDKITSEGTADVGGKISLKVEEGEEVEIGAVVAEIDESASGEASGGGSDKKDAEQEEAKAESTSPEEKAAEQTESHPHQSPAVRRIAEESGVDPKGVQGSGKGGRVTKGDMLEAVERQGQQVSTQEQSAKQAAPAPAPKSQPAPAAGERQTRKKMTPLRKTIAKRLVEASQETAMLTTFNEVNMEPVMKLRKTHQDAFVKQHGVKLGFMSFFTKAVVHALKAVPDVNAQIEGDTIVQNHYYDIGLAMSTPRGLMVPVVRDPDQKNFAAIEQDILDYAKKAKEGKITIDDLQGGVFTITNGGIFGSMLSTPIINRPQSAILGMHNIQERPMAENGQVVIKPMMYLALSYDHRLIDGKEAVTFLVKVKQAIEDPTRLLFEI
ncbi:MAG: 2-oxoglutarate dehydrogenase E2 component (dihydrolipoamide succinyltransferase) [Puniceicoccaceae bacterium 5H]|nr:MAG: 2-oxoglutarate dehydrogenase E2 component (dihydrolipoamide succinyltransferase) [Puniceicoccaceae bacterium 5H]